MGIKVGEVLRISVRCRISASTMKECIDAITAVVDEGRLKISEEGFRLRAVDPANVAMVSFELSSDAFEEFEFEEEEELEVGIDFVKLSSIIDMGKGETAELEFDTEKHKLYTKLGSLAYTISLLDPSTIRKEPKVPELDLPVQVVIEADVFRRAIRAAEKIGDHILLGVDGDVFYMETESDTDKVRFELGKEQLIDIIPGVVRSMYSLEYLSAMSKGLSKADHITLSIGKDYPLRIDFELADGYAHVSYLLAPRIEAE